MYTPMMMHLKIHTFNFYSYVSFKLLELFKNSNRPSFENRSCTSEEIQLIFL